MDQDIRSRYVQTVETVNHELLQQDIATKTSEIETLTTQLMQLQQELDQLRAVEQSVSVEQTVG